MVVVKVWGCSGYVPLRRRLHVYRIVKGLSPKYHTPHIDTSCLDASSRDNPLPVKVLTCGQGCCGGLGGNLKKKEMLSPQCASVFIHIHYHALFFQWFSARFVMEKVDLVMVGAEGVAESGGIINKVDEIKSTWLSTLFIWLFTVITVL